MKTRSLGLPSRALSGDFRRASLASAACRSSSFDADDGLLGLLQSLAGCPFCQHRIHTSALVQSRFRCPGRKQQKHSPAISGDATPHPATPASFRASRRCVHIFPLDGLGISQTSLSCTLARPSGGSISLTSGRGATLPPDDSDEIPRPETWSPRRGDADETDSELPSGTQRRENPGGCEAEESMAGEGEGRRRRRRLAAAAAAETKPTCAPSRSLQVEIVDGHRSVKTLFDRFRSAEKRHYLFVVFASMAECLNWFRSICRSNSPSTQELARFIWLFGSRRDSVSGKASYYYY
jgi:hypothetical protein